MADRPPDTGTPRWVKVFMIVFTVLILLFVVLRFTGGGSHGPGRHAPSDGLGGHATPLGDHG